MTPELINFLDKVFIVFIMIGFIVPVLSLLTGCVDAALDFDIDLDLDGCADVGFVGYNFNCLLFALFSGGIVGEYLLHRGDSTLIGIIVVFIMTGTLGYLFLYRCVVYPLKTNRSFALLQSELIGKEATVIQEIKANSSGNVELIDAQNSKITYIADCVFNNGNERDVKLGEKVKIIGIKDNMLLVECDDINK